MHTRLPSSPNNLFLIADHIACCWSRINNYHYQAMIMIFLPQHNFNVQYELTETPEKFVCCIATPLNEAAHSLIWVVKLLQRHQWAWYINLPHPVSLISPLLTIDSVLPQFSASASTHMTSYYALMLASTTSNPPSMALPVYSF